MPAPGELSGATSASASKGKRNAPRRSSLNGDTLLPGVVGPGSSSRYHAWTCGRGSRRGAARRMNRKRQHPYLLKSTLRRSRPKDGGQAGRASAALKNRSEDRGKMVMRRGCGRGGEGGECGVGTGFDEGLFGRLRAVFEGFDEEFERFVHGEGSEHGGAQRAAVDERLQLAGDADAETRQSQPLAAMRLGGFGLE